MKWVDRVLTGIWHLCYGCIIGWKYRRCFGTKHQGPTRFPDRGNVKVYCESWEPRFVLPCSLCPIGHIAEAYTGRLLDKATEAPHGS